MAAVASPTPLAFSFSAGQPHRPPLRTAARNAYSRISANRSPPSSKKPSEDSSDEDDLAPIKLSAEAQAILGEDNSQAGSDKENINVYSQRDRQAENSLSNEKDILISRLRNSVSPPQRNGSPVPRVVRLYQEKRPAGPSTLGRDGSFMYKIHDRTSRLADQEMHESQTPKQYRRVVRVSGGRPTSKSPAAGQLVDGVHDNTSPARRTFADQQFTSIEGEKDYADDDNPVGPSTVNRTRRAEEHGVQSTMRVRRIGVGSRLGKPVRRGMIRRPSEEDEMSLDQPEREQSRSPEVEVGRRAKEPELEDLPDLGPMANGSPQMPIRKARAQNERSKSPLPAVSGHREEPQSPIEQPVLSTSLQKSRPTPASNGSLPSTRSSSSQRKPIFKIPSLPPLPSGHDQENEPPPTFKKSKPSAPLLRIHQDEPTQDEKSQAASATPVSPNRQPLAAISNNSPRRPAPAPPPKMSLLEAATSNAGSRKKSSAHVLINGKPYRRLDCIGRGGSSRVYRIMADNFRIFAMKRVSLEDADMAAIAGYKGEIDLLKKLENVDRVIRLFDFEINEEKGTLNVMMELGESDFNKMLNEQLKTDNAKLDITFTRHYWKEMLECVAAVHEHDIVHSDLKPANFLLVKGQLKLIDFGIANAIQDNTVNVHRENQIGTPNYMSPESLICQVGAGPGGAKEIKLGKPSDVWSLGCILYQMTYGQPPFAHITQQMQRIMAIPNPKVEIQFPTRGIGGSVVPFGLIKTLRRCLIREQSLRPTVAELLSDTDPFLCPVAISPDMLGRVIGNVVSYCRRREEGMKARGEMGEGATCLPKDDEMRGWPGAFYDKLRQAQEEGTAW